MDSEIEIDDDLMKTIELFKGDFEGADNNILEDVKQKLDEKSKDINNILKILSLNSINDKEIPLNTHINISLYLKYIVEKQIIDLYQRSNLLVNIMKLFSQSNKINHNLENEKIVNNINSIVQFLLSHTPLEFYYSEISTLIPEILSKSLNDDFLLIAKYYINFCCLISKEDRFRMIYSDVINICKIIIRIILERISNYIDDKKQIYNDDYLYLSKKSYDCLYICLTKCKFRKRIGEMRTICSELIGEHSKYILQIIRIYPPYNKLSEELYGEQNSIIVFSVDNKKAMEINQMKFCVFQFLDTIIKILTFEDTRNNELKINEKELIELVYKIIDLIIKDFKDIINNKAKYNDLLKNIETKDSSNDYIKEINLIANILLYFLKTCLIIEPFQSNLSFDIQYFIIDVLFPIIIASKEEKATLNINFEVFNKKFVNDFYFVMNLNSRNMGCFLICNLCNNKKIVNFLLNLNIEMLNYVLNEGKIENNFGDYNVFYKYKNNTFISQIDDMTKIDLSLLIIIILKNSFKDYYFKHY